MMRALRVLLLLGCLVALTGVPAAARQSICLDGLWECAWGDVDSPPGSEADWRSVEVPSTVGWRVDGPHCLWYRTSFFVPVGWAREHVLLRFEAVKYSQRVRVNGAEVGRHLGGYEPAEYDITEHVLFGKRNEVVVGAEDWTSLVAVDARVEPPDFSPEFASWVEDGLLAPIGSRGWELGIWQSVFVEAQPEVWVEDVFVTPSVREQKLWAYVTVKNDGGRKTRTTVTARVTEGGAGPAIAPQEVSLGPGEGRTVEFEVDWYDARLWSPEDPHLYRLVAGVRAGLAGDSKEVRFGFREFWIEGAQFFLNGRPIHLLATAAHPMPQYDDDPARAYEIAREAGCVAMRLHAQPWPQQWYDAADEFGMLLVWESGLWCLSRQYGLTRDEFWQNARDHLEAQVKRQRNHPSIVIWSAENELLLCGGASIAGVEQKVGALADVIRSLDPTRPIMFDGDEDPDAKADIVNLHYPHEPPGWNLWPETAYWLEAPVRLDTYPRERWEWDRSKPLYLGEFLWIPPTASGAGSVFFGDAAYPDVERYRKLAKAAAWEMQVIAARDAGVSGTCPWNLWEMGEFPNAGSEAHARAYRAVAAFPREVSTRAFAGTVVERTITVLNDTPTPKRLELRWSLKGQGEWHADGSAPVSVQPAGRVRVRAELALPPTEVAETRAAFAVELWEDGRRVFGESEDWKVFGRAALSGRVPGALARVAVFDPMGETTQLLRETGIGCIPVDADSVPRALHQVPIAVVGKGAFERPSGRVVVGDEGNGPTAELLRFVQAGGVLLVFEQEHYPPELIPASLTEHDSTIAFARRPQHPALTGLEEADLAHWLCDGIVGRDEIAKPDSGGFLTVVDSGGAEGLATAGLAEVRVGQGRMVLCQLDVTRKFGVDPVATKLVRNLLAYASKRPPGSALTGAVCDDPEAQALDVIGLRYDRLALPLSVAETRKHPVLVLCDVDGATPQAELLQEYVRQGGRVVLHKVTPETAEAAERIVGTPFSVSRGCDGWVSLVDRSGPAAGMSNQDLAWFGPKPPNVNVGPSLSGNIADCNVTQPHRKAGVTAKLEAEEMKLPDTGVSVVGDEEGLCVGLFANAELRTVASVARGGYYLVSVRARGTAAAGVYPRVVVRVDGAPVGSASVSAEEWETLTVAAPLPAGEHMLGVSFDNDYYAPPEDRNLWLDWVSWTPVDRIPTEVRFHTHPGVLASMEHGQGMWVIDQVRWDKAGDNADQAARYLGTLLTNLGCEFRSATGTLIRAREMDVKDCAGWAEAGDTVALWANGVLEKEVEFAATGEYTIRLRAQGTQLDEVYPQVEVRVDGAAVGVVDLTARGWREYGITAEVAEGVHTLGVAFVNDAHDPPQDRNLTVASISIVRSESQSGGD